VKKETENKTAHRMMPSPLGNSHARQVIPAGVQRGPARAEQVLGRKPGVAVGLTGKALQS
jgi:hypothetical protein